MAIVNEWQQVKTYPTPIPTDLLFYEIKDSNIPRNENWSYGDPHPNKTRYPNHELIFVTPVEKGKNPSADQQWWYAAKRENQDLYNFSFSKADIGGTKFDSVMRSYVTLRSEFNPDVHVMGQVMPNSPSGLFAGDYVLAERSEKRINDQILDGLFVAEELTYVKKVNLTDNAFDERLGVNLARTTTLYYRGENVEGTPIETLVADDKNAYWGTQVIEKVSRSGQQLSANWFAVIEQQITLRRNTDGTLVDNWPIGQVKSKSRNILTPQKFRIGTEVVETTTPLDLQAADVDNLPEPAAPTDDEVEVRVTKINDYRYEKKITTEKVNSNINSLVGENYGKIVTTKSSEILVEEGSAADTGILVISSDVTPLGDGKAVKTTIRVQNTSWDDPVENELSKEVPNLIPGKFSKFVTQAKHTRKTSSIPNSITLAPGEKVKSYKKETPDRVEETVVSEEIDVSPSALVGEEYGNIATYSTSEKLVDEGDLADTGLEIVNSKVEPLGNGKAIKTTTQVKNGTWPDPLATNLSRRRDNLVPAKFLNFITRLTTIKKLQSVPNNIVLTEDEVAKDYKQETPDRAEETVVQETIDESTSALVGEEYGNIVTYSTSEKLVDEDDSVDTGLEIVNSKVEPLGNGKAIKTTTQVKNGTWPDPLATNLSRRRDNLVPAKFLNFITRRTTVRKLASVPDNIVLSGNEVAKDCKQETPDRAEETMVQETIDENTQDLKGSKIFGNYGGGVAKSLESLVLEGAEIDEGYSVIASSVEPLGNGKAIKSTLKADEDFPTLEGADYNRELDVFLPYTQQVKRAGIPSNGKQEITPIDKWRSMVKDFDNETLKEKLKLIYHVFPTQDSVSLPNTLKSAKVLVSRTLANGDGVSGGSSGSSSSSSSVSVSADLSLEIEEGYNGVVDAEVHVFFLEANGVTKSAIENKVSAQPWPKFRPVSTRVVIAGNGITKSKEVSSSNSGWSWSESSNVNAFTNVAAIPACLCSGIEIAIEYQDHLTPVGVLDMIKDRISESWKRKMTLIKEAASQGLTVFGIDTSTIKGYQLAQDYIAVYDNEVSFTDDLVLSDFPVTCSPSSIASTTPASIEPGRYIKSSNVALYGYGMAKVTVVVVNI